MRALTYLIAVFLWVTGITSCFPQQLMDTLQLKVRKPELRKELLAMLKRDQQIRTDFINRMTDFFSLDSARFVSIFDSVDTMNTARMKQIIAQYGWPGTSLVGKDGAEAAFSLVEHADRDTAFQIRCLALVQQAYANGEASGEQLAMLTDRIRVNQGRPQVYGNSITISPGGTFVVDPIEDEANVDKRRAELGLLPLSEYLEALKEALNLKKK
ncbi:MAG: hypothetical protein HY708_08070 [Ignavibacteriae bacterium]|nr:hypothetical protein [Ignavibacteriota bacterium]